MPKLSIDIGVKLGDSLSQLDKLNSALIKVDTTAKNLASSLKNIGNVKVDANVNAQTPAPPPPTSNAGGSVKNPFADYVKGASDSSSVTDVLGAKLEELIQRSVSLKATLAQIPVFDIKGFEETNTELKGVENQIKQLQNILKSQSLNIVAPKNVPDIFKEFRSGASSSGSALDFLKQKEQDLLNKTNELRQSLSSQQVTSSGYQAITRDIQELEKELTTVRGLLNVQAPDIFADFRSGAIQASTALEFLEKKEGELIAESANLRLALTTATSGEQYTQLEGKLDRVEKELNQVTSAIQKQQGAVSNSSGSYTRLTAAQEAQRRVTNLSNLSLINFGRVAQDLPFGILGIANNLNPLIEGLKQTSDSAKAANSSLGKELLKSLQGFGGVTLAISALSAVLSFASVGLSYWSRKSKEAKESNDELKKSADLVAESYSRMTTELNKGVESRSGYEVQKNILEQQLRLGRELTDEEKLREKIRGLTQAQSDVEQGQKELRSRQFNIVIPQREALPFQKEFNDDTENGIKLREKYAELLKEGTEFLKLDEISTNKISDLTGQIYLAKLELQSLEKGIGKDKDKNNKKDETAADIYKEINDDLKKFQSLRNLDPLEKTNKSTDRINSGLDEVIDKFGTLRVNDEEFKKLERRLAGFKEFKVRLEISQIKQDLETTLNSLKLKGSFFSIDTTKEQIKTVENTIDALYEKFQDKRVSFFEKQDIFLFLGILQGRLKELKLNEIFNKGKEAFNEFNEDIKKLEIKSVVLNISTNKEQINVLKKTVDALLERKIELISKGDISRATILTVLLNKIKSILPDLQIKVLREDFDREIEKLELEKRTIDFTIGISDEDDDLVSKIKQKLNKVREQINITQGAINESLKLGALDKNFKKYTDDLEKFLKEYSKLMKDAKLAEQATKAADILNNALSDIISTFASTIAEGLGKALAGKDTDDLFREGLKQIGSTIKEAGKQMTALATLVAAFKANLFKNPFVAIAAGLAMTILGSYLENKEFAEGGYVSGPGSERSDSIPARLSNGEFVIKAKSVRKYGRGFMEMLNSGNVPISNYKNNFSDMRFADGGFVTRQMSSAVVNRSDFGNDMGGFIAETKISGQDLKLVLKRADSRYNNAT